MRPPPFIVIQLVHISGPLKGRIQEFSNQAVILGRHSSCNVTYPAELAAIAEKHAEIIREGNRFKLIDHSAGRTFVNGKRVGEVYLRVGDVIILTEEGPKVSFLTRIEAAAPPPQPAVKHPGNLEELPIITPLPENEPELQPESRVLPEKAPAPEEPKLSKAAVPLSIQFGTVLRSYQELPVTIGTASACDFTLAHPALKEEHAVLFFSQDQYWIRELGKKNSIYLNNDALDYESPLEAGDTISLAKQGPCLQFLGDGRLAEYEEQPNKAPAQEQQTSKKRTAPTKPSFIKKIFKK